MKSKLKLFILFFLIFAVLGYCREFFFVHLNIIMFIKYYHDAGHASVPSIMDFFMSWSYDSLYYSKYVFTVMWTLIYFVANYYALKVLTKEKIFLKLLLYAYAIMFVLAGLSMLYGYFVNHRWNEDEYTLSRWLMGIAQSPLLALIFLASETLYKNTLKIES